jgi:hypothetical protein
MRVAKYLILVVPPDLVHWLLNIVCRTLNISQPDHFAKSLSLQKEYAEEIILSRHLYNLSAYYKGYGA